MSETEFETGFEEQPEGGGGYEEGGELDPFADDFGQQLGATVQEGVQTGVDQALAALGLESEAPPADFGYQQEPVELSEEDLAQADANIGATFDQLEQELGGFDREEAFEATLATFSSLIGQGMDPEAAAAAQALIDGAQAAAQTQRGMPHVERLVQAELMRVGRDVNPGQIMEAAEQFLPRLLELTGGDHPEAARAAIEMAASAVAGRRWAPSSSPNHSNAIADYYGAKAVAIREMERAGAPVPVPEAKPGQHVSTDQLIAKYAPAIRRERGL